MLTIYNAHGIYGGMHITPAAFFSALAHDTRLRCLLLLLDQGELCVCELTHAIGAVQPHTSRHLAQLREAGLVTDRRAGLWIYYRISPDLPDWMLEVLHTTARGVDGLNPYATDAAALAEMANRPSALRCA